MEETLCISPYHQWKSSPSSVDSLHRRYHHVPSYGDLLHSSKLVPYLVLHSEQQNCFKKHGYKNSIKRGKNTSLQDQLQLVCKSIHRGLRRSDKTLPNDKLLQDKLFLLVDFSWLLQQRLLVCSIPKHLAKTFCWKDEHTEQVVEANDDGSSSTSNAQQPQSDEDENDRPVAGGNEKDHNEGQRLFHNSGNNNNNNNNNNNPNGNPNQGSIAPSSPHRAASIRVIDGTKKVKYGTTYWVQRNVITIQLMTSFAFHSCLVTCCKDTSHETPKSMETIGFYLFQLLQGPKQVFLAGHKLIYEYSFKRKLPFTSGRPETQKGIWLKAEFYGSNNELLETAETDKFFVCSRPNRTATLTDGASSSASSTLSISPTISSSSINSNSNGIASGNSSSTTSTGSLSSLSDSFTPSPPSTMSGHSNGSSNASSSTNGSVDTTFTKPNYFTMSSQLQQVQLQDQNMNGNSSSRSNDTTSMHQNNKNLVDYIDDKDDYHLHINSIHPNTGSTRGGQYVTLEGRFKVPTSMQNSTLTVYFGLLPSPHIAYMDSSKIVCVTPARIIAGNVRVTGVLGGKTFQNYVLFSYDDDDSSSTSNNR